MTLITEEVSRNPVRRTSSAKSRLMYPFLYHRRNYHSSVVCLDSRVISFHFRIFSRLYVPIRSLPSTPLLCSLPEVLCTMYRHPGCQWTPISPSEAHQIPSHRTCPARFYTKVLLCYTILYYATLNYRMHYCSRSWRICVEDQEIKNVFWREDIGNVYIGHVEALLL